MDHNTKWLTAQSVAFSYAREMECEYCGKEECVCEPDLDSHFCWICAHPEEVCDCGYYMGESY